MKLAFLVTQGQTTPMLQQHQQAFTVSTRGREFHEITEQVGTVADKGGIRTGMATVHLHHTSASLVIQENADPGVRRDLERFMARVCPDGDPMFEHDYEGADDMPAHVRTALTAVNLSIPITNGHLALGTWQGIYLWEHRHAGHSRKVTVHVVGE